MNIWDLEKQMISFSNWNTAPKEAYELAISEHNQGIPTGIGKNEEIGWYVIQSSGQGPYLIWQENES